MARAIDGNATTGWAILPQAGRPHQATFETAEKIAHDQGSLLVVKISQQFPDGTHTVGRFRLSATTASTPIGLQQRPKELAELLDLPAEKRSAAQQARLVELYRAADTDYDRLKTAFEQSENEQKNQRLIGVQDLAWALINNPAFLFNQ